MKTISSQRYIDESTVESKIENQDFTVFVSPAFEIDGEKVRVVLDGHHSLQAAKQAGVDADFVEQDATDNDTIGLLNDGDIDGFLVAAHMGDDYYDTDTGADIW